jgi:hypothetical protein
MKYRLSRSWPVSGGSAVIPGGVVIDDQQPNSWGSLVRDVVPPPDVIPLDTETRDWLMRSYQLPDHNWEIAPVPTDKP